MKLEIFDKTISSVTPIYICDDISDPDKQKKSLAWLKGRDKSNLQFKWEGVRVESNGQIQ